MGPREVKLAVFAWLPREGFVPAGLLTLSETVGAKPLHRALTVTFQNGQDRSGGLGGVQACRG